MSDLNQLLDSRLLRRIGVPHRRQPQNASGLRLPQGTQVVSADNHLSIVEDIWYERLPASLKDKAPRVWQSDGICHVGFDRKSSIPSAVLSSFADFEQVRGCYDMEARMADLRKEGIEKELAFANGMMALIFHPDFELRAAIFKVYNEYLAELQQRWPGFYGVGFINYWEPRKARENISELKSLGLKTFFLPINPGKRPDGAGEVNYTTAEMDEFWNAVEELDIPVSFHIGEGFSRKEDGTRGMFGTTSMQNFAPFRRTIGELIFGGILDRHPQLKIVFAEGGINWLAAAIQDADFIWGARGNNLDWEIKNPPRYYWENNLYATFMIDAIGLQIIDQMPAGHVMWASDYPHPESTYGYSGTAMQQVLNATTPESARAILGGNAIEVYGL